MKKNYFYNLLYQVINILVPLLTIPYVSRVLGPSGVGEYTVAYNYAQYFVLFGTLGLTKYSSREIAYVRDDKTETRSVFWELMLLRTITLGIATITYLVLFFVMGLKQSQVIQVCIIYIVTAVFDISWYFIGVENFKKVAVRDTIIKLTSVFLIFTLLKNNDQVWLYALILSGTQFISQCLMWISLPKDIWRKTLRLKKLPQHLKVSLSLFVPSLAIQVYMMLDRLMLGEISGNVQVGLYESSQKVIRIATTIVTAISTVSLPRVANLYSNNKKDELQKHLKKVFSIASFLAFPMCFGFFAITADFTPWFFGNDFVGIDLLIYISCFIIVSLGWSNILGDQILVACGKQNQYTIAVVFAAGLNFIMNLILIPKTGAVGAAVATLCAEFSGMLIMLFFCSRIYRVSEFFKNGSLKYFVSSLIMGGVVLGIGTFLEASAFSTLLEILVGAIVYLLIMAIMKDSIFMYGLNICKSILLKLRKE